MRFEVVLKRDKLKSMESIFKMVGLLLRAKTTSYRIHLIYISENNELRILINREEAPILIVLFRQMFYRISSHSRGEEDGNSTIGLEFKNGGVFIEEVLTFLKGEHPSNMVLEEDNAFHLKIGKEKDFRYVELKFKNRCKKIQIFKPSKNEAELYQYDWIDGVRSSVAYMTINMTHIMQMLKFVSKCRTAYPLQILDQKKLSLELNLTSRKCRFYSQAGCKLETVGIIHELQNNNQQIYMYEVKLDDCEWLIHALKHQSSFVVDKDKNLTIIYQQDNIYQCQIGLQGWVKQNNQDEPQLKIQF